MPVDTRTSGLYRGGPWLRKTTETTNSAVYGVYGIYGSGAGVDLVLKSNPFQRGSRQTGESIDAPLQHGVGAGESEALFDLRSFGARGIRYAPMGGHGLARPDRADLVGRVVADGEHEIQVGRTWRRKFVPGLRAKRVHVITKIA